MSQYSAPASASASCDLTLASTSVETLDSPQHGMSAGFLQSQHDLLQNEYQYVTNQRELIERNKTLTHERILMLKDLIELETVKREEEAVAQELKAVVQQREASAKQREAAAQQQRCAALLKAVTQSAPKSNTLQHASVSAKKPEFPPPDKEIEALKKQLLTLGRSTDDNLVRESLNTRIQELERQIFANNHDALILAMKEFIGKNPEYQRKKDLNAIVQSYEKAIDDLSTKLNAFKRPPMPSPAKQSARASAHNVYDELTAELDHLERNFPLLLCPAAPDGSKKWQLAQKRIDEIIGILTNQ